VPERLGLFAAATLVIAATPGPNMLLVMTASMRSGFRRSFAVMAGCLAGVVAMIGLSAAGLDLALRAAPRAFWALRMAGAAYLLWLGVRLWQGEPGALDAPRPARSLFRQGLLTALSNPKAIVFAAAFLPQFIDPGRPRGPQFAVLVAFFALIEVACYLAYAAGGRQAAALLADPRLRRGFDRCAGAAFALFALLLVRS